MKFIKINIISLFIFLGSSLVVYADCTSQDIFQMKSRGFSDLEIMRICGAPPNQSNPFQNYASPIPTNICQTPNMWCVLNQLGPVGAQCWCATPYGPVTGTLVPRQ